MITNEDCACIARREPSQPSSPSTGFGYRRRRRNRASDRFVCACRGGTGCRCIHTLTKRTSCPQGTCTRTPPTTSKCECVCALHHCVAAEIKALGSLASRARALGWCWCCSGPPARGRTRHRRPLHIHNINTTHTASSRAHLRFQFIIYYKYAMCII